MPNITKPLTPLQAMTRLAKEEALQHIDKGLNNSFTVTVIEVDPNYIKNWKFHDRPEIELGDIEALAKEFKEIGQQQPCIVRPLNNLGQYKYEVIAGERRWRAAATAKMKLKVIVKNLSDSEAALIQITENSNRKDLSDYAKGMSYAQLIEEGILQQKDLIEKLGKSKQYISSLLSFSKIPKEIISAIGDMTHVSRRSAEQIRRLSGKGERYIKAILTIADKIRAGKYGQEKIEKFVLSYVSSIEKKSLRSFHPKVLGKTGRHLFTWRTDNNHRSSIHFPKDISNLIKLKKINLTEDILNVIEQHIGNLK